MMTLNDYTASEDWLSGVRIVYRYNQLSAVQRSKLEHKVLLENVAKSKEVLAC